MKVSKSTTKHTVKTYWRMGITNQTSEVFCFPEPKSRWEKKNELSHLRYFLRAQKGPLSRSQPDRLLWIINLQIRVCSYPHIGVLVSEKNLFRKNGRKYCENIELRPFVDKFFNIFRFYEEQKAATSETSSFSVSHSSILCLLAN